MHLNEAIELAEYLRDIKYQPEQVQDFYPTPGTLSTTMFYTGLDPITMKKFMYQKQSMKKLCKEHYFNLRILRNII